MDISGATNRTYTIGSLSGSDAGTYSVVVSGPCTSVTNSATLTVNECMPVGSGAPQLNRQTGLFEQKVSFTNSTQSTFTAIRVLISGLRPGVQVYNASGDADGIPFVQYGESIAPGEVALLTIEYYVPDRRSPGSTLCAKAVSITPPIQPDGASITIDRIVHLTDGTMLIEFAAVPGQVYSIQYCDDFINWKTVVPGITTGANRIQWIDNGPPKTECLPNLRPLRFYRVIAAP